MNPRNVFPLAAFAIIALLNQPPVAWSEEAPTTLATLAEKLAALEKDLAAAVAATQKTVDEEIAAGRLKDPAAQSLRWSLKNAAQNLTSFDSRSLVNTARVPSDNDTLRSAIATLENAIAATQGRRTTVVKEAQADLKLRVAETVRTAERSEQITPLIEQIETLREAAAKTSGSYYGEAGQLAQQAHSLLTNLQRVIAAEREGEPRNLGSALSNLRSSAQNSQIRLADSDVQARVDRVIKPLVAAAETARQTLEKNLIDNRPATETTAAFARFEEASKRASGLRSRVDFNSNSEETQVLNAYRQLVQAQTAAAKGDALAARRQIEIAQSALDALDSASAERLRTWLGQWKATMETNMTTAQTQRVEKIRARLASIKTAAELEEYAAEMTAAAGVEGRDENGREAWLFSLAQELSALASQWITGSVSEMSQVRYSGGSPSSRNLLTREISALRNRAERESVSRALRAPELLQSPLLEQPLEAAVETLCDDLAKKAEWRRLYRVLENRGARHMGRATPDATMAALQSYFAGQNFELAEQWSDAVAAYKAVLKTVSDQVPVKEVGERLKALKKEHPEAFVETAPATKAL